MRKYYKGIFESFHLCKKAVLPREESIMYGKRINRIIRDRQVIKLEELGDIYVERPKVLQPPKKED